MVAVLVVVIGQGGAAFAAGQPTPDPSGNYAACAFDFTTAQSEGPYYYDTFGFACNVAGEFVGQTYFAVDWHNPSGTLDSDPGLTVTSSQRVADHYGSGYYASDSAASNPYGGSTCSSIEPVTVVNDAGTSFQATCTAVTQVGGTSGSEPAYPSEYWTGGTASLPPPPTPSLTCSRVIDAETSDPLVHATATDAADPGSGYSDGWSWAWDDGSAASSGRTAEHTMAGSMPSGGWVITVTETRTGDGSTYSAGPVSGTCDLLVNPSDPDVTTPGSPPSTGEDSDCPTGWGWLNPLAITGILKCLFVPTSASSTSATNGYNALKASALGLPIQAGTDLASAWSSMAPQGGAGGPRGAGCDNLGVSIPFVTGHPTSLTLGCSGGDGLADTNGSGDSGPLGGVFSVLGPIMDALVWVAFAFVVVKLLGAILGLRLPGLGGGGDDEDA